MTQDAIRSLPAGESLWDRGERASVRGLHCVANADGSKSFLLYYRTKDGRQRKPKIGTFGDVTLGEARRRAKLILERVAVGEDPKGDWEDQKKELLVKELWERVWADHWSKERFVRSGWGREAKRLWEHDIEPDFGNSRLSEVTAFQVREWHRKGLSTPYNANRALAVLSKMFRYAEEQELKPQHSNPCFLVKKHPENKRKRYATEGEIATIAPLLDREAKRSPAGVAFLYTLMLTGSRPIAIERATWEQLKEFELNGELYGILTFEGKSSAKTGEDERVIIPPQVMKIIRTLPRVVGETIFGIKMPRKLWKKIKEEAGCPDLWARDWRRTFATVGMSHGVGKDIVGELLNHRSRQTTDIYAKLIDTKRVEAATQIANKVDSILKSVRSG
jgi:integrase